MNWQMKQRNAMMKIPVRDRRLLVKIERTKNEDVVLKEIVIKTLKDLSDLDVLRKLLSSPKEEVPDPGFYLRQ